VAYVDKVEECEERLAGVSGRGGAVLVSRATVGLAAVLRALGLPRGSGVVMPVMCCANVVHAVKGAGLEPLFVDMEVGFGIDLGRAKRVVTAHGNVRVQLAVPLFGGGIDMAGLVGFAERHGLAVVADLAQFGMRNVECGVRNAVASVYSFGLGKIGDAGGGGAVVSDDAVLLQRVRGEVEGKRELREIAERIRRSLDGLEAEMAARKEIAERYRAELRVEGVEHPGEKGPLPLWKYSVLVKDRGERDRVTRRLLERGVEASNLYAPLSRWFGGYADGGREKYGAAWGIWERIINLPLWPAKEGTVEDVLWAFRRR